MSDLDIIYSDVDDTSISSFDDVFVLGEIEAGDSTKDHTTKVGHQDDALDFDEDWNAYSAISTDSPNASSEDERGEQQPKSIEPKYPSVSVLEETIFKLNRRMLESARTRAMVSKTIYPDLKQKGYDLKGKKRPIGPSTDEVIGYEATGSSIKNHRREAFRQDNSICTFLRATKRW